MAWSPYAPLQGLPSPLSTALPSYTGAGPPISVEAMQQEADRIQAWLVMGRSGPEVWPGRSVPGGHSQPLSCRPMSGNVLSSPRRAPGGSNTAGIPSRVSTTGDAEREALRQENIRLRHALEATTCDRERALAVCTEAEVAEHRSELEAVEVRLQRMEETEENLRLRLEAESRERSNELEALRGEFHRVMERWHMQADRQEADHVQLQQENFEAAERLAATQRNVARQHVVAHASAPSEVIEIRRRRLQSETADLQRELSGRSQRVHTLATRLARCEGELSGQPSAADVGAQRDVLRVLQRTVARLQPRLRASAQESEALEESTAVEEACAAAEKQWSRQGAENGAKALMQMQAQLAHLRHMYATMRQRCEGMEKGSNGMEEDPAAWNEQRCYWEDALGDHRLWLARGEDELRQLHGEFSAAEQRCAAVCREESHIEAAANQDRVVLEELRRQLRRSNARNAGLEVEARLLGLPPLSLAAEPLVVGLPGAA